MANELFKASILAELNTTEFEKKMAGLKSNPKNKITVTLEAKQLEKQLSDIEKRLNALQNIKIDPFGSGSSGSGGGSGSARQINQNVENYNKLMRTYQQMSKIQLRLPTLDTEKNSAQINALNNQLNTLRERFKTTWGDIKSSGGLSAEQFDKFTAAVKKTAASFSELKGKIEDTGRTTQSKLIDKIEKDLGNGKIDATISKLQNQFDKLAKSGATGLDSLEDDLIKVKLLQDKLAQASEPKDIVSTYRELCDVLDRLKNGISVAKNESEKLHKSFKVGDIFKNLTGVYDVTSLINKGINVIKGMAKEVTSIDTSMTQLKIVTNATKQEYQDFYKTIAATSKEIGISANDLIDSATTYARLGYSLDESGMLAKYTGMLQNVGDIDVSSAQDAITAITKAFGINANEIESVMDKLVVVGNNFPVSVAELATGINNAGSMMASAGNSFEQTIALLTAANVTVQDINKSSTGLRTISARIRKTTSELDDLGEVMSEAKYGEMVKALTGYGVSLTDLNGEYRSTYDILRDIAAVWDDMSSMDQAALAETLAGTRQQNVLASILTQFKEASGAMDAMANSAGALSDAYSVYEDSIQTKIDQLKATWSEFVNSVLSSDLLKWVVDVGKGVVNVLNTIVNAVGSLPTAATIGTFVKLLSSGAGERINQFQSYYAMENMPAKP